MSHVYSIDDLELELKRILLEKSDMQDILMKIEAACFSHEQDKQKLQEELKKVTSSLYEIIKGLRY